MMDPRWMNKKALDYLDEYEKYRFSLLLYQSRHLLEFPGNHHLHQSTSWTLMRQSFLIWTTLDLGQLSAMKRVRWWLGCQLRVLSFITVQKLTLWHVGELLSSPLKLVSQDWSLKGIMHWWWMQYHALQRTTPCWDTFLKTSKTLFVGCNMLQSTALKGVVIWLHTL